MSVYLISYDLKKAASHNYTAVHEKIKSFATNGWAHILESTFLVDTTKSADSMVEGLTSVYPNECCFIVKLTKPTDYQGRLSKELWEWINARLG